MAFILRKMGEYDNAIQWIQKVLKIDSKYGYAYASLAEIYVAKGEKKIFLNNVELALKNGCPISDYLYDPVYKEFLRNQEFLKLLKKYNFQYRKTTKS